MGPCELPRGVVPVFPALSRGLPGLLPGVGWALALVLTFIVSPRYLISCSNEHPQLVSCFHLKAEEEKSYLVVPHLRVIRGKESYTRRKNTEQLATRSLAVPCMSADFSSPE